MMIDPGFSKNNLMKKHILGQWIEEWECDIVTFAMKTKDMQNEENC